MSRAVIAVAALTLTGLTGCGTVQNFSRPEDGGERPLEVYGGVTRSVESWKPTSPNHASAPVFFTAVHAANVGLSAIGDTLTLPLTGSVTIWRIVDVLNYMADNCKIVSIFDSDWWQFWCNGEPTPVAQPAPPTQSP